MKTNSVLLKLLFTSCLVSVLAACGNNTDSAAAAKAAADTGFSKTSVSTTLTANAFTPAATAGATPDSPTKPRDLSAAPTAAVVNLGAPTAAQSAPAQKSSSNPKQAMRLQVGFSRQVAQTATIAATQGVLNWAATPSGGKVAAISFTSTDAKSTRLGLLVTQLPETATLRFYAKGAAQAYEFSGKEVNEVLAKNLAAGDKTDAGRTYWGPVIEGIESTLEIELPAGVATSAVQVSVPKLSHIFISDETAAQLLIQPQTVSFGGAKVCQVDISCTTPLPAVSNAINQIRFIDPLDGLPYTCSATLINDSINSGSMYVLTANHCVDTQTAATSISTLLFYRSNCASGGSSSTGYGPRATMLYTAFSTDSTLLKFYPNTSGYSPLNNGAILAGWDATTPPAANIVVTNIHHPRGDAQRISIGTMTSNVVRDVLGDFYYTSQAVGTFLEVVLTNGLVEPGSSGSALFKDLTTNPKVIGQLWGGFEGFCSSNTTNNPQQVFYGRFDKAYAAGMSDWLNPVGNKPVSRFYNTLTGTHFYTIAASETTMLQTYFPSYSFEGTPFKASVQPVAGLSPVHRFYNLNLGVHFYTILESERAFVAANLPQMRYEGIAWYAQPAAGGSTIPLYRFYNRDRGVHFYTVSLAERDSVIANLKQMNYEGIAYYVLP
jgi:lysyl endopeptidase